MCYIIEAREIIATSRKRGIDYDTFSYNIEQNAVLRYAGNSHHTKSYIVVHRGT